MRQYTNSSRFFVNSFQLEAQAQNNESTANQSSSAATGPQQNNGAAQQQQQPHPANPQSMRPTSSPTGSSGSRSMSPAVGKLCSAISRLCHFLTSDIASLVRVRNTRAEKSSHIFYQGV